MIIGIPYGEKREQNWKYIWRNYVWKLSKSEEGNRCPDIGSTEVPNKLNLNRPMHIIIKMPKVKEKERRLKAAREKQELIIGNPYKAISQFLSRNAAGQKGLAGHSHISKREKIWNIEYSTHQDYHLKKLSDKQKLKEYSNTKPILKEILKDLL